MTFLSAEVEIGQDRIQMQDRVVCVIDASSYVGFCILKGLLKKGWIVHAAVQPHGNPEILKKITEMSLVENKLKLFIVDMLDYHSITEAVKDSGSLFCTLDSHDKYNEFVVDLEVRGAINVVEACAQSETLEKVVFTSSLAAGIWRENASLAKDVDERSWSDPEYCKEMKLWYALAKTLSEKAARALAMDRSINMVSINSGLVLGPGVACLNPGPTMSYLRGADKMCENGVLASVEVDFLVDVHIRALEDSYAFGRYFCFNDILNTERDAMQLAQRLSPLIPMPEGYECVENMVYEERLRSKKLKKLMQRAP